MDGIPTMLTGVVLLVLAGCGGPGLPPAGPQPGDVDVGYGTQPEEKVTGAVTSVSPGELGHTAAANIAELLRGRVAGLEITADPNGGYRFRIRGIAMINETPEPLFVVDGTPVDADRIESVLSGFTREDIRQVDVLKDVASTSIYGTRGVGGVIIITTRR
ncbi:MAG: TonB-dependent receptor plug domain-containing protein [Longimicrobiales bacterium]